MLKRELYWEALNSRLFLHIDWERVIHTVRRALGTPTDINRGWGNSFLMRYFTPHSIRSIGSCPWWPEEEKNYNLILKLLRRKKESIMRNSSTWKILYLLSCIWFSMAFLFGSFLAPPPPPPLNILTCFSHK